MTEDLMKKLMVAKAIMDKQDEKPRGQQSNLNSPMVENFDAPKGTYNIPDNLISNGSATKSVNTPSIEAIKNSKLPDAIKKIMIEHPIKQQQVSEPVLSNELIEKASKLMGAKKNAAVNESTSDMKKMIKDAVNEALRENGLITESEEKSNDFFSFKVGSHIFEGKITKIKKMK